VTPTLYTLLGRTWFNHGLEYGSPLFVPADKALLERRREAFLLASSYGPTYAVLRNNGRDLYVSDLTNGREYAYDLRREPLGEAVPVNEDIRRVNQRIIETRLEALADLHRGSHQIAANAADATQP
jgi:hypothetical protein